MSPFLFQPCPKDDDEQDAIKLNRQAAATKARRDRQQRYREKQRQYVNSLETTVKRLRMDVDQQLHARHHAQRIHEYFANMPIRPMTLTASSVITCMRECMKTFELGTRDQQIKFLESATCTDVRYGESVGRDSILKHWVNLALLLRDSAPILLEHCESSVGFLEQDVAVGYMSALLVIRLTTRSLATAFPLTLSSTRLRDKMLQNPTFGLPMTTVFQFDEQGKICRYDPTIDLVTGLYAVIRDYRDVASILESANIDASGEIRGLGLDFYCGVEASLVDKHSVAFLLASGEDTRQTDTGGQTATRVAGV
ncbi:hypothetical protein GN244_ATG20406 [Phytophthora infestans]|uniref:BZIP domain-containing protein n=1 Tax=Phytophthora infestans TaxID=4787 RepID=A0A833S2C7_PHYIN|nr:hypothetical protein GN244_ATG20406 [Phytophthora infestans]KAF4137610.1 hypothetical protein GN958_ATG13202 [Phytophthora infestans]